MYWSIQTWQYRRQAMKIEIGSYGAKTKLPELLRQVKTGKSFTITNRGEAIAELVPMGQMGSWANGVRSFNIALQVESR